MLATREGYAVPDFLAKALAAFFWFGLKALGLPNPLGRGFSYTGFTVHPYVKAVSQGDFCVFL